MRNLIIVWMIGTVITLSGCAMTSAPNQSVQTGSGDVRVSGDVNAAAINRSGF